MADISKTISNIKFNDAGGNKVTAYFKDGAITPVVEELTEVLQKNFISFGNTSTLSPHTPSTGLSITYNNDGSFKINGTASSDYLAMDVTFYDDTPLVISTGRTSSEGITFSILTSTGTTVVTDTGSGAEFTPTPNTTYIAKITLANKTYSNLMVYPMICTKAMWNISQEYVTRDMSYMNDTTYTIFPGKSIPRINPENGNKHVFAGFSIYSNTINNLYDVRTFDYGLIYSRSDTVDTDDLRIDNVDGTTIINQPNVSGTNIRDDGAGVLCNGYYRMRDKYGNISPYIYICGLGGKYSDLVAGDAVVDLVDNCKDKNKLNINKLVKYNATTSISGDSMTITANGTWSNGFFIIPLKAGTYVWSCSVDALSIGSTTCYIRFSTNGTESTKIRDDVTTTTTGTVNAEFTLAADTSVYITYYVNYSATSSTTNTATFSANMVCSKEDWFVSRAYEPYRHSYDELISNVDTAYKASSIPLVETGSSSTADAFVATVPNITELRDGLIFALRNTVISNNSGATLNVNNLGAKTMYTTNGGGIVPQFFGYQSICVFVYNSKLNSNAGGWILIDHNPSSMGIGYTTCDTAAADTAKIATLTGYKKVAGGIIVVKFTNAVPANSTLNISSQGEAAIRWRAASIKAGIIEAGDTVTMMFSGTYYNVLAIDKGISLATLGCGYVEATLGTSPAFTATLNNFTLKTGGIVTVKFSNDVPANATLNINSTGDGGIYWKGSKITAGVIKSGDVVLFSRYSTRWNLMAIDRTAAV